MINQRGRHILHIFVFSRSLDIRLINRPWNIDVQYHNLLLIIPFATSPLKLPIVCNFLFAYIPFQYRPKMLFWIITWQCLAKESYLQIRPWTWHYILAMHSRPKKVLGMLFGNSSKEANYQRVLWVEKVLKLGQLIGPCQRPTLVKA